MLYPKIYVSKKEKSFIENLEFIKENAIFLIKVFKNYNSLMVFFNQKFHF